MERKKKGCIEDTKTLRVTLYGSLKVDLPFIVWNLMIYVLCVEASIDVFASLLFEFVYLMFSSIKILLNLFHLF